MKYKVLIVEDEEVIANTIKKQLESWNMEADCVEDFHNVLGKFVDLQQNVAFSREKNLPVRLYYIKMYVIG